MGDDENASKSSVRDLVALDDDRNRSFCETCQSDLCSDIKDEVVNNVREPDNIEVSQGVALVDNWSGITD